MKVEELRSRLSERVLVGDGGMGSELLQRLPEGSRLDVAAHEHPQQVLDVHLAYSLQSAMTASGLGLYLAAKQLAGRGHCRAAIAPLLRALELGLPDRDFSIEALRVLGRCRYIERDYPAARETFHLRFGEPEMLLREAPVRRASWR